MTEEQLKAIRDATERFALSELDDAHAGVLALLDEIESLRKDAERLDWLEQNLFNRENVDWLTKKLSTTQNMWVMFAPVGAQGSARGIIDAAMEISK